MIIEAFHSRDTSIKFCTNGIEVYNSMFPGGSMLFTNKANAREALSAIISFGDTVPTEGMLYFIDFNLLDI